MGTERGQKSEDKKRRANSTQASSIARVQLSLTAAARTRPPCLNDSGRQLKMNASANNGAHLELWIFFFESKCNV